MKATQLIEVLAAHIRINGDTEVQIDNEPINHIESLSEVTYEGVTFAGRMFLDRADRNTPVGNVVLFAPGGQMAHEAAVGMRRIDASVSPDLLEEHGVDVTGSEHFVEPPLEAEEAHSAPFKALRLEMFGTTGYGPIPLKQCPSGMRAQVQGQN